MTENKKDHLFPEKHSSKLSIEKIGLRAGLITCASLIAYFIIMRYLNFMNSAVMWGLNFIIIWEGINLAYRYYRSDSTLNVDYFQGLILGGITTAISVIPFVMFVYIYFSLADAEELLLLKNNIFFMGEQITPLRVAAATMIEGLCSGVIISFTIMQYLCSGFKINHEERIEQW